MLPFTTHHLLNSVFDIGFWEILLISVLALLVVGPERLPRAARTAGLWFGRARRYIEGVKEEVASEFDVNELKRMVHNQEVMINDLQSQLKETVSLDDDDDNEKGESGEADSRQYDIIEELEDGGDAGAEPAAADAARDTAEEDVKAAEDREHRNTTGG